MIGKFIDKQVLLRPMATGNILLETMFPGSYEIDGKRCLIGVMADFREGQSTYSVTIDKLNREGEASAGSYRWGQIVHQDGITRYLHAIKIEIQFDYLCHRFGIERINRVIRERVLRAKLRVELANIQQEVSV